MRYNPAFDGLRAFAVLVVVAFHSKAPIAWGGFIGVDVFFVLSGYLITTLLVAERQATGTISLPRFYGRRALRLWPTLLAMLVVFVIVAPFVWPDLNATRDATLAGLYLSDYSRAFWGFPKVLSYTWSLAVEEHFYLLWPLLLPLVMRAKSPARVLLIAYAVATLWRGFNFYWLGWEPTYYRFDTRASGLILGCLLAFYRPGAKWGWWGLVVLAAVSAMPTFFLPVAMTLQPVVVELASAAVIVACVAGAGPARMLAQPMLAYVGKLSYGIYLWHGPLVYWMRDRYEWPVTFAVVTVVSVALAAVTYHLVDVPLRRLRAPRLSPAQVGGVDL